MYCGAVRTQVIVLNGGSSSGKSGIARCLQAVLPDPWLALGADTLIKAMPVTSDAIEFPAGGEVVVGPRFRELEAAWIEGVAASQQRWRQRLGALPVLWVGVRCDSAVAAGREIARGDRVAGMAAFQADVVHQGVGYDLEVDTTHREALECAREIAARLRRLADHEPPA